MPLDDLYSALRDGVLAWYAGAARPLPWRQTRDPYPIFLSEIILQQTRVAQGTPYYFRFLEAFPTVQDLAQASEDEVLRLWQGLGYYSRGRNMLAAARLIAQNGWPQTAEGLARLPGIGPYTAAAIASIAFGEAVPVLDGNVARVLSRWFDRAEDISKPATQKEFRALAARLIVGAEPAQFNQAMMEFGALFCVPGNPPCLVCPVRDLCAAFTHGTVAQRPMKAKAGAKKVRHLLYVAVQDREGRLLVRRREGRGIWQGLHEMYVDEGVGGFPVLDRVLGGLEHELGIRTGLLKAGEVILDETHVLSHQQLLVRVVPVRLKVQVAGVPEGYRWVSLAEWEGLGKPVPMVKATERLA